MEVDTIYFGGGTPSFIAGEQLLELMTRIRQSFQLATAVEVTIEVNPGSADSRKIDRYLEAGVNRVSIGMQTFQDDLLERIGRSHRVEDALSTFELCRSRGLRNINLDLIAGLPGQTPDDWRENLETASSLSPEHISMYLLEIHENTQFGKIYGRSASGISQRADLPSEDWVERFYLDSIRYFQPPWLSAI